MSNALYDLLFPASLTDRPFLLFPDSPALTRAAFDMRSHAMAAVLAEMGLRAGMRLVVQTDKSPDLVALYAACIRSGVVFVPLNPTVTVEETRACLQACGATCAIVAPDRVARLRQMTADGGTIGLGGQTGRAGTPAPFVAEMPLRIESLSHDGTGSFADLVRAAQDTAAPPPPVARRAPTDAAVILHANDTGAGRRGVVLSQEALVHNTRALADLWQITPDDILCHALPLHQAYGLTIALNVALAGGAGILFIRRYDPATLAGQLEKSTVFMGVPSFYGRLLAQNDIRPGRFDKMRLLLSGTAPLPADTHAAFLRQSGHAILDRFAMADTGVIAAQGGAGPHPHGEAGPALPGVALRITDDDGHPLPPATTGMIEVRSPALCSGYVTANGFEAPALRPDGWFVTGELGHLSPAGALTLVGKAQEHILSGGFSVDPAEVEAALAALPAVKDSSVIGLPHPAWGEMVVAVVVPKSGTTPDAEEMLADLGYALARFKRPHHMVFVDDLPRNALGRVRKDALRQDIASRVGAT